MSSPCPSPQTSSGHLSLYRYLAGGGGGIGHSERIANWTKLWGFGQNIQKTGGGAATREEKRGD